ncbi:MAG: transposase, partial [Gammaproteobacteria bacterium]|nr:transposase [Gammaproteobacteria bacterium]
IDASAGTVEELDRMITRIRERWPAVEIVVRGDSGFCREALMSWCEAHSVHYVLGLARNKRLEAELADDLKWAEFAHRLTGQPVRFFNDFTYRTLDSWSRSRRVIGKAEYLSGGPNPRFIVTSISAQHYDGEVLYEHVYCARGDMENRIKGAPGDRRGVGGESPLH